MAKNKVVWNGIEYDTIMLAAQASGYAYSTMAANLAKGYVRDEDIPRPGPPGVKCEWNGIHYDSIKAAAIANGVSVGCMRWRILSNGYSCDEDLERDGVPTIFNGIEFRSLTAAARSVDMSAGQMLYWLSKDCDTSEKIAERRKKNGTLNRKRKSKI